MPFLYNSCTSVQNTKDLVTDKDFFFLNAITKYERVHFFPGIILYPKIFHFRVIPYLKLSCSKSFNQRYLTNEIN